MNFKTKLKKGYLLDSGYYYEYQDNIRNNTFIEDQIGMAFREIKGYTAYPENYYMELLSDYFLYRTLYAIEVLDSKEKSITELARVNEYTNILIRINSRCCRKKVEDISLKYFLLEMENIIPLVSISFLSQNFNETKVLTQNLINSLNAESCIIERGISDAHISWFTIELLSIYFNINIDKEVTNNPKKGAFKQYKNILDKWDIKDIIEVEKMIYILIELNSINIKKEQKKFDSSLCYATSLFPYEILTWLKLRELKGLKNPTEFSHPLMNTPIAKMLLDIKEPLPKPKELPYAKELLETLKEKCPDVVEIPKWLDIIRKKYTKKSL